MKKLGSLFTAFSALTWLGTALTSHAGTHTWTGGNTSGLWSVGSNWENNSPPFANESPLHLIFPTNATRRLSTNNIPNLHIDSMTFAGAAYTLAGNSSATNVTFNSSEGHSYWNIRTFGGTGHQLLSSFRVALDGNLEFMLATNSNVEISSQLGAASVNSGLSKDGPGTLILSPSQQNTFDGTTSIRDGTLRLEGGFVFMGSFAPVVTVPGQLIIGNTSPSANAYCLVWQPNQIADDAAVMVDENGELDLADVDETIGSLTMKGGYVDTLNAKLTLNGNVTSLEPISSVAPAIIKGHLDLGILSRTFQTDGGLIIEAEISGGAFGNAYAGITKTGPSSLSLEGQNTYDGYTFVQEGRLYASTYASLGSTNRPTSVASNAILSLTGLGFGPTIKGEGVTLYGNARLDTGVDSTWAGPITLAGHPWIVAQNTGAVFTIEGVIDGTGGFVKNGYGEVVLAGANDNTFTGLTEVWRGKLTLAQGGVLSGRVSIPGPLTIGGAGTNATVKVATSESISGSPVTIDEGGRLELGTLVTETLGPVALNSGTIDTGLSGYLQLFGDFSSTNSPSSNSIVNGRIDFGNSRRNVRVVSGSLVVNASVTGGAAGTIFMSGGGTMRLSASNTFQGRMIVQGGTLMVNHSHALGTTNGATVVSNNAALWVITSGLTGSLNITNELLELYSTNDYGALLNVGTNYWYGSISLKAASVDFNIFGRLALGGTITGNGGFLKQGDGELVFNGPAANTFTGSSYVQEGLLTLDKPFGGAMPGNLSVGQQGNGPEDAFLRLAAFEQFSTSSIVTVNKRGRMICEDFQNNSIGNIGGAGTIQLEPGTLLKVGFNNIDATFNGSIVGGDSANPNGTPFEKHGAAMLTLGGTNLIIGNVDIKQGTVHVSGFLSNAVTYVRTGSVLRGTGRVRGVQVDGGTVWPGAGLGSLRAESLLSGAVSIAPTGTFRIKLEGDAPGIGYDRLDCVTAPLIDNLKLELLNPPTAALGQQFLILSNNSASPVLGAFNDFNSGTNLNEGAKFYVGSARFQISYSGGDGNDVVVTRIADPKPAKVSGYGSSTNGMSLNLQGEVGTQYRVEAKSDLGTTNAWTTLGTVKVDAMGLGGFIDSDAKNFPKRFYRLITP